MWNTWYSQQQQSSESSEREKIICKTKRKEKLQKDNHWNKLKPKAKNKWKIGNTNTVTTNLQNATHITCYNITMQCQSRAIAARSSPCSLANFLMAFAFHFKCKWQFVQLLKEMRLHSHSLRLTHTRSSTHTPIHKSLIVPKKTEAFLTTSLYTGRERREEAESTWNCSAAKTLAWIRQIPNRIIKKLGRNRKAGGARKKVQNYGC